MPYFYGASPVPYVSVEDAARLLRVNVHSIYRNLCEIPHIKVGNTYRIRCEWLLLEPPAQVNYQRYQAIPHQDFLPFDVKPMRVWRNTGKPVYLNPYGHPQSR